MDGVNDSTIWTWNTIGKRSGAWNLDPKAPEAKQGFLLNHLISEFLTQRDDGYRHSNSDPITGQGAWFDLRVRIEKSEPRLDAVTLPQFAPTAKPPSMTKPIETLRYGQNFRPGKKP
jgi:sulfite dehydrogenase (quinone) subunit SoeA